MNLQCEAWQPDALKATQTEIDLYMNQIPEWKIIDIAGVSQLERMFTIDNFILAAKTDQLEQLL